MLPNAEPATSPHAMTKKAHILQRLTGLPLCPLRENALFFLFMFLTGWLSCQVELTPHLIGAEPYEHAAEELFVDLYLLCLLLSLIPRKVRRWVRGLLAVLLYAVAIADVYCYVRFESMLTPTMLMLVGETNSREASEFLSTAFSWTLLSTPLLWFLLIPIAHLLFALLSRFLRRRSPSISRLRHYSPRFSEGVVSLVSLLVLALFLYTAARVLPRRMAMLRLLSSQTVAQMEDNQNRPDRATLYLPVYRLLFSIRANQLAARQVEQLVAAKDAAQVDSCTFRSPHIVLIIGESQSRHHSQLYGYAMPTTPHEEEQREAGRLTVFTDVVTPWNLTSYAFRYLMSLHGVSDEGDWCDAPLFPTLFRKAGYTTTFITNQFLSQAGEAIYDFSGGFFMNHPELSRAMFDRRNTALHPFDETLLDDWQQLCQSDTADCSAPTLTILHLMGSHMSYKDRYPQRTHKYLRASHYDRPDLTPHQRLILADYDNSVRYTDSIAGEVMRRLEHKEALVLFLSDHGEEVFDDSLHIWGRMHTDQMDYRYARAEFEIPFWIWYSDSYRERHPEVVEAISRAADKPFMTDNLSHILLWLAGIHVPYYRDECNPLSPHYDAKRPRLLKARTDYNTLQPSPK